MKIFLFAISLIFLSQSRANALCVLQESFDNKTVQISTFDSKDLSEDESIASSQGPNCKAVVRIGKKTIDTSFQLKDEGGNVSSSSSSVPTEATEFRNGNGGSASVGKVKCEIVCPINFTMPWSIRQLFKGSSN